MKQRTANELSLNGCLVRARLVVGGQLGRMLGSVFSQRVWYALLEGGHGRFFDWLSVVPTADVQRAVDREQKDLIGRRPMDVARLASPTLRCLSHRALDRNDHVAQMRAQTRRQSEGLAQSRRDPRIPMRGNAALVLWVSP